MAYAYVVEVVHEDDSTEVIEVSARRQRARDVAHEYVLDYSSVDDDIEVDHDTENGVSSYRNERKRFGATVTRWEMT